MGTLARLCSRKIDVTVPESHRQPSRHHTAGSQSYSDWPEGSNLLHASAIADSALVYVCHLLLNPPLRIVQLYFVHFYYFFSQGHSILAENPSHPLC